MNRTLSLTLKNSNLAFKTSFTRNLSNHRQSFLAEITSYTYTHIYSHIHGRSNSYLNEPIFSQKFARKRFVQWILFWNYRVAFFWGKKSIEKEHRQCNLFIRMINHEVQLSAGLYASYSRSQGKQQKSRGNCGSKTIPLQVSFIVKNEWECQNSGVSGKTTPLPAPQYSQPLHYCLSWHHED